MIRRLPSRYDHIYRLGGVINRDDGWSTEDVWPRLAQQLVVRLEGQKILPVLLLQEPPEIRLSKVLGHLLADLLPRLVNCTLVKATFVLHCLIHSVQVQRFLKTKNEAFIYINCSSPCTWMGTGSAAFPFST